MPEIQVRGPYFCVLLVYCWPGDDLVQKFSTKTNIRTLHQGSDDNGMDVISFSLF